MMAFLTGCPLKNLISSHVRKLLSTINLPPADASCNFDTWYCGWDNGPDNSAFKWIRHIGPTPSRGTGPSKDHTSGQGECDNGYLIYWLLNCVCNMDESILKIWEKPICVELFAIFCKRPHTQQHSQCKLATWPGAFFSFIKLNIILYILTKYDFC